MPSLDESCDEDFDAQLRGLFQEAEQVIESRAAAERQLPPEEATLTGPARTPRNAAAPEAASPARGQETAEAPVPSPTPPPTPPAVSLAQVVRPILLGLEALTRATGENTTLLQKFGAANDAEAPARQDLPQVVSSLRDLLEQKSGVNQQMFDALHQELKGYKDGFLLESVHRPIIRDLVTLYDDLVEIHRQLGAALSEEAPAPGTGTLALIERLRTTELNVEHNLEFIIEVLARLEVTPMSNGTGKLDKRTQRAVAVELAEDPDHDTMVVRSMKRGFLWKERVLRAEEVVIQKWKEGFLMAMEPRANAGAASPTPNSGQSQI